MAFALPKRFLLPILAASTLLATVGCGERVSDSEESSPGPNVTVPINVPPETLQECPTAEAQPDSGVITYTTENSDEWPPFDGPLHITLPPAEVPEQIRGPFVAVEAPEE